MADTPPSIVTRSTEREVAHHLPSIGGSLSHRVRFNGLDHQQVMAPAAAISCRLPLAYRVEELSI
jgi:hypothetical protein